MNAPSEFSLVPALRAAVNSVWRGSDRVVDLVLTSVLAGGHLLLQDVPGVGKTTLAAALASAVGGRFSRIQFTADLLPGDVTGVTILEPGTGRLVFREGPVFANVLLADEINRTTPRTQSALLEAMQERRVTTDGVTRDLPRPFLVVATQNPYDYHGTYPLPDSQLDRFLMRLSLGYPDRDAERDILRQPEGQPAMPAQVADVEALARAIAAVERVVVSPEVEDYLLDLVWTTRADERLLRGVSPRGAQALFRASRAHAALHGRGFVIPEDVRNLAVPVLAHRIVGRAVATDSMGGASVIRAILDELATPR